VGVNIDITPRLHHDDDVTLALKVTLSSLGVTPGFGGLPTFGNREITTTIRLKDGETNMLAGLIRDEERTVMSGIPGLSDLPLVGHIFASNHKETQQTDIILTLTPHIVRVLEITEADLRSFRLGREPAVSGDIRGDAPPPPREERMELPPAPPPSASPLLAPSQTAQPPFPQPLQGTLPGTTLPKSTVPVPKKPGGGGS
jgi:general secretion pathway protein D